MTENNSKKNELIMDMMTPEARARALGVHVMWSFPEQGLDPEVARRAFLREQLPPELLEGLSLTSAQAAFTVAMKYATRTYRAGDGTLCRLSKNHLKSGGGEANWNSYALNVAAVEDDKGNILRQVATVLMHKETGKLDIEYTPPLASTLIDPADISAADYIFDVVSKRVSDWTGKLSRESLNSFLVGIMVSSGGFYWVVKGNSWFVPNPDFGGDLTVLPPTSPLEVIVKVARVLRALNAENIVDPVPIFPDDEGVLSRAFTARQLARKSLEEEMQQQLVLLKQILQRDKRVIGSNLAKRRAAFEELRSKTTLYVNILGAEMDDIHQQLRLADQLMNQREASELGLDESALAGLW